MSTDPSPVSRTRRRWLWIVGMINAFNFMDGIDGLTGIQPAAAAF